MKYLSIDIETTGLNSDKHQILEFAAVLDDLKTQKKIDQLPFFHCFFEFEEYSGTPYALALNKRIFEILANKKKYKNYLFLKPEDFIPKFLFFIKKNKLSFPLNVAGKNFSSFDLNFLKKLPLWNEEIKIKHRVLDPGILFLNKDDESIPSTETCKKRSKIFEDNTVLHTALDDAKDVIKLIRNKI
jgi:DNA polymerase III epsilon subunit-like protein